MAIEREICTDIDSPEDKNRCKSVNQVYNQCCQDCNEKYECKDRCDYAYNWGCQALKYVKVES